MRYLLKAMFYQIFYLPYKENACGIKEYKYDNAMILYGNEMVKAKIYYIIYQQSNANNAPSTKYNQLSTPNYVTSTNYYKPQIFLKLALIFFINSSSCHSILINIIYPLPILLTR